jgi:glycosyltransferase involved in cell wall biosynthesis
MNQNNSKKPLVSAIMAARNVEMVIGEAIESIQRQTYPNWELIIVNDASTDTTAKIVERYMHNDSRIKLLHRTVAGGGPGPARSTGIAVAQGIYLAIADADDISLPTRFAEEIAFLEKNKTIDGVSCSLELISEDGVTSLGTKRRPSDRALLGFLLLLRPQFMDPGLMIKKQAVADVGGYDSAYVPVDDYELQCRLVARGKILTNLDTVLCRYRVRAASVTHHESFAPRAGRLVVDIIQKNIQPYFALSRASAELLLHYIIDRPLGVVKTVRGIYLHRKMARTYIAKNKIPADEAEKILVFYRGERNHHIRSLIKRPRK